MTKQDIIDILAVHFRRYMTKQDIIDILDQYPDDIEIEVMGFEQGRCNDWEAWHSPLIKYHFDEDEKILYLEGDLTWE